VLAVVEYLQVAVSFVVTSRVWVVLEDEPFGSPLEIVGAELSPSSTWKVCSE